LCACGLYEQVFEKRRKGGDDRVCRGWCVVDIGARDSYTLEPARGERGERQARGTRHGHSREREGEELERRARAMDGSVASKGSEREAARPQRRGDYFVFAQPIRRPQLSSATVQATNNILDRGHQTLSIMHDEASNDQVGGAWVGIHRVEVFTHPSNPDPRSLPHVDGSHAHVHRANRPP
jgi:hypothetical protein